MAVPFTCRRVASGAVGGGSWVVEFSKVAAALGPRGISASRRVKGRRLVNHRIFSGETCTLRTSNINRPQHWFTLICPFILTAIVQTLTGLAILVSNPQEPSPIPTITSSANIFLDVFGVVYKQWQHKNFGLFVGAATAAAISSLALTKSLSIWLCCKQSQLSVERKRLLRIAPVVEMISKQASVSSKETWLSREMVANGPAPNLASDSMNTSSAFEILPRENKRHLTVPVRSESTPTGWAHESIHLPGTAMIPRAQDTEPESLYHNQNLAGTSQLIPNVRGPTLNKNDEKVHKQKVTQRILRRVGSLISFGSSSTGPGHNQPSNSRKVLTIGAPTEFRHVSNLGNEVALANSGVPTQSGSPMVLIPIKAHQPAQSTANYDVHTTSERLTMGNPLGSKSVPNLGQTARQTNRGPFKRCHNPSKFESIEEDDSDSDQSERFLENGPTLSRSYGSRSIADLRPTIPREAAGTAAEISRPAMRKPVPVRNGGPIQLGKGPPRISITQHFGTNAACQLRRQENARGTRRYPKTAQNFSNPSRGRPTYTVDTLRSGIQEEGVGFEANPLNEKAKRDLNNQDSAKSSPATLQACGNNRAAMRAEKKRQQQELISGALARRGSCMVSDYNGTGQTVHFKVVGNPDDRSTQTDRPVSSASSDTLGGGVRDSRFPESGFPTRAVTNDSIIGSGGGSLSRNSSEGYQMSGSSSRQSLAGESSLKLPTKPSSDTHKTRGNGFFRTMFKKEPSIAALNEYSKREYASKGVDPRDPNAAAKMNISSRQLPPEAPKAASKEPKKKKGGGLRKGDLPSLSLGRADSGSLFGSSR